MENFEYIFDSINAYCFYEDYPIIISYSLKNMKLTFPLRTVIIK